MAARAMSVSSPDRRSPAWRHALAVVAAVMLLTSSAVAVATSWTGAWGAAPQPPVASGWSQAGFAGHSLRQVVRLSTGGSALRLRLSNRYGTAPLQVADAAVGRAGSGAEVRGVPEAVTFGRAPGTVIPPGREIVSDAVRLPARALERVAVTLYFAAPTGPATFHEVASATSFRARGDHRFTAGAAPYTETSGSWYFLTGVDALGAARGSVVAFGDSITDGTGSSLDADNRYPDQLAERLAASGRRLGVLNSGLSGNRLLDDSPCFGEKAVTRFRRDVLDRPGVRSVIVMAGINDIGSLLGVQPCFVPGARLTAERLIQGHRLLIGAARESGVRIIGGTIVPFRGSPFAYSEEGERVRATVNTWIRTSGEYDAVADFERALAGPDGSLRPEYNARDGRPGDFLHPNDAGLDAMAAAIDLSLLE